MSAGSAGAANAQGALAGVRVVELAGMLTPYCGKLFADLGAEVVLVEPPGGSRQRREPPFLDDRPGPETSLAFAYDNCGKKSVTLDLETQEGRRLLRLLVADADIFVESEPPGRLAGLGLGYPDLAAGNGRLVMTSVTAFGQDGPYAHYAYSDLTLLALGGLLYLGGYPDTAPIRVYGNQAVSAANLYAAVASISAYHGALMHGDGEHVDVSAQQCVTLALESSVPLLELEGTVRKRFAGEQRQAGTGVFPSSDGYIYLMAAGIASNRFWNNTVKWLQEEGVEGADELAQPKWAAQDYLASAEAKQRFGEIFLPFSRARTSEYLYRAGQRHRMPICPVCTPAQVLRNRQLASRGYFADVAHAASGRTLTMPGAPYKLAKSPWRLGGSPPMLGQHNGEVLGRVGVAAADLQALAGLGVI
jgi:benzylsuccinate CoA-transferase BbsE subunit